MATWLTFKKIMARLEEPKRGRLVLVFLAVNRMLNKVQNVISFLKSKSNK